MRLQKLPTIQPKPNKARLVLSRETMSQCMDNLAQKGWSIELKYFPRMGWQCSIRWTNGEDKAVWSALHAQAPLWDANHKRITYKDSYDCFEACLRDWKQKYSAWAANERLKDAPPPPQFQLVPIHKPTRKEVAKRM